ncbi:3-keto-5-aminohexanoate cleavage protein [Frankia nepalensis]|nr:3-keto-5-aminohexanoate cleavage protein [Frankia nepalensis]
MKACLNGSRGRADHPAVPVTPAELAAAAAGSVAAGAEAVHLHPRDHSGAESLAAAHIGPAVRAVRERCPGIPVGVSTGLWITGGDPGARQAAVDSWARLPPAERPDFASVNVSEPGFAAVVESLLAAGIAVEAGVWSVADAEALAASGLAGHCARLLVEIINAPATDAENAATAVLTRLDDLRVPGPRLLHGEGPATWPLVALAGRLGLPTRIGLEDTLTDPAGRPAADNAALIHAARALWSQPDQAPR